jgi:hypothetical protein
MNLLALSGGVVLGVVRGVICSRSPEDAGWLGGFYSGHESGSLTPIRP